ncbi:MAG: type 4a pilus biogenesis protein PilO [Actinomycetota bacterium]|nr:type 4a pilus biogenesis protein PilO [Actinomycetota bacterium]
MSSKMKQWVALTVVGCLAVLAAGWFLLVSPKRSEAAAVRADVDSQNSTNAGLQTQLAMLKAQAKTLPQQQAKLARVAAKIPDNPALPALIRALSKAADDAGVELISIGPGTPLPVAPAAAAAVTPTAGSTSAGASTSSAPKAPTTLSSGSSAAATAGVLNAIPLSINVVGGYFQLEQFFDRLENLARATKVTGFSFSPGTNPMKKVSGTATATSDSGKVLSSTVTASVYMAVGRGLVPTAAVPAK